MKLFDYLSFKRRFEKRTDTKQLLKDNPSDYLKPHENPTTIKKLIEKTAFALEFDKRDLTFGERDHRRTKQLNWLGEKNDRVGGRYRKGD